MGYLVIDWKIEQFNYSITRCTLGPALRPTWTALAVLLLATSLLHASGIGLGMALAFLSRSPTGRLTQATGMAICVAGVMLLVGAVA